MTISFRSTEASNAPIVALHSSASSSAQWSQLEADLDGRFDVHAFDLPGYGRAPLASDHSQKGAAISAASVIREIEKLGSAVHLVGHSNGGGIAIKIALMRPDLVKSLTVYEPAAFHFLAHGNNKGRRLFQQIKLLSGLVSGAAAEGDAAAGMQHFLDFWNGDGFWDNLPDKAKKKFAGQISSVMTDFANGFAESWTLKDLANLEMPALVMTGLESPEIAQNVAVAIAKTLPNARIALLPELGHMAPIFQPEWVNSRIFEHVANAERPIADFSWPDLEAA
ncbi:alpha/beta fold hydrolase [Ruegeria conchae]|uniref:Pimeloyl-ACP methyl ester carboxylesterase n=1 Tax=Ruegeria conchae TaxID=981384 RepID=A0A497Z1A9_9RHOB|nr:alpha/beta hydrolase [Ruegeria conchae]RLJ99993.1 pimeloyl-ACP methyl ester carboxylesterase [Ruegeria conchae]